MESQNISYNRSQSLKLLQTSRTITKKLCRKLSFMSFDWLRVTFNRSNALFDQTNKNQITIELSRDSKIDFLTISIDQAKVLTQNFNFSLRKFQNLNLYFIDFMKQYSANSNIIITTYSCIYLYIQHRVASKLIIN